MRYKVSNKLQFCKFGGKSNIKISLALSIAFSKQLLRFLHQKLVAILKTNKFLFWLNPMYYCVSFLKKTSLVKGQRNE